MRVHVHTESGARGAFCLPTTPEQLLDRANALLAEHAYHVARARWALEDGDVTAARHWARRAEQSRPRIEVLLGEANRRRKQREAMAA